MMNPFRYVQFLIALMAQHAQHQIGHIDVILLGKTVSCVALLSSLLSPITLRTSHTVSVELLKRLLR